MLLHSDFVKDGNQLLAYARTFMLLREFAEKFTEVFNRKLLFFLIKLVGEVFLEIEEQFFNAFNFINRVIFML